tara:strand:+ start:2506 stop:3225 length:720 start_codon:yes stop_codon:yes gene_type:complete
MPKGRIMGENKASPWKGEDLKGTWVFTRKLDGIRMLRDAEGNPVARSGKPLYNLQDIPKEITDAEIFDTDFETSTSLCRSSVNGKAVSKSQAYSIFPLDPRLYLSTIENPSAECIKQCLQERLDVGDEGLILRQGMKWIKIKPKDTADVRVTGFQEGKGKHEGRCGAILTNYGKLGTGFSDEQREMFQKLFDNGELIGIILECSFMEWTKYGKMRHPVFERIRYDKDEESLGEAYENLQ